MERCIAVYVNKKEALEMAVMATKVKIKVEVTLAGRRANLRRLSPPLETWSTASPSPEDCREPEYTLLVGVDGGVTLLLCRTPIFVSALRVCVYIYSISL